jgi:hypothetical protein
LTPGAIVAQSCHAAFSFSKEYPEISNEWQEISNYIGILTARNEVEFSQILEKAASQNIKFSAFKEPDLDNQITAIALEPGSHSKKLCSQLPLALRSKP